MDYEVLAKRVQPDPGDLQRVYTPDGLDLSLRGGSAGRDAGVVLPNITDGFAGRAPDFGAFETGRPPFHYGPRRLHPFSVSGCSNPF